METDILAAHNAVRSRIGIPPLKWSARLADQAQGWANRLLAENRFVHRPDNKYGENVFEITGTNASPAHVVYEWDAEAADYDYAANKCRKVCGHYTQLVWAATKTVGCGVARNARREVWVCNYDPPGNYIGKRPY
jgi:pathogenesis-related protein 1